MHIDNDDFRIEVCMLTSKVKADDWLLLWDAIDDGIRVVGWSDTHCKIEEAEQNAWFGRRKQCEMENTCAIASAHAAIRSTDRLMELLLFYNEHSNKLAVPLMDHDSRGVTFMIIEPQN